MVIESESNRRFHHLREWIHQIGKAGYDVHELKGGKNASKRDLYKDADGNIYVKPKGGAGEGDPTGININDL